MRSSLKHFICLRLIPELLFPISNNIESWGFFFSFFLSFFCFLTKDPVPSIYKHQHIKSASYIIYHTFEKHIFYKCKIHVCILYFASKDVNLHVNESYRLIWNLYSSNDSLSRNLDEVQKEKKTVPSVTLKYFDKNKLNYQDFFLRYMGTTVVKSMLMCID